jgi:metallo-beta-lactamase family protein
MKVSFHGATEGVTGSCHMLECCGKTILVDCGLYQGSRELDEENAAPFGFDPASIDYVLLTHAHLDHCGRLPLLVKRGFRGEIIATAATKELARVVLIDSAHLQEEEALHKSKRQGHHHGSHAQTEPLYTLQDAFYTLEFFGRSTAYGTPINLAPGLEATFFDAGHILGSASIYLELNENGHQRSIVFSGDLGNAGRPLLRTPHVPHKADAVVMETTYGDRLHKGWQDSVEELYAAIEGTFQRGGNVIIPTFALERAQEILYFLHEGVENKRLPASMQVFLDSPMAISATQIFERHPECYSAEVAEFFREGRDPFHLPGLHFTRETADSMAINRISGGAVIMAGSGMCTGGRVRHHLDHNLWRNNASIIFVGYAAIGTLARRIIDGAKSVRLFGKQVPVRAAIHTINGFSAHADQAELLAWQREIRPAMTFLVHGDPDAMQQFSVKLKGQRVEMPKLHQSFDLQELPGQ